ncbi:MAG: M23 family metallopeptidase [Elusimicrobia bacterium]|nr:M23 family metallopeptidase [Elusimicrobiota bacterium]
MASSNKLNKSAKLSLIASLVFSCPYYLPAQEDDGLARSVPIDQADLDSVRRQEEEARRQAEYETWIREQQTYYNDFMQRNNSPLRWGQPNDYSNSGSDNNSSDNNDSDSDNSWLNPSNFEINPNPNNYDSSYHSGTSPNYSGHSSQAAPLSPTNNLNPLEQPYFGRDNQLPRLISPPQDDRFSSLHGYIENRQALPSGQTYRGSGCPIRELDGSCLSLINGNFPQGFYRCQSGGPCYRLPQDYGPRQSNDGLINLDSYYSCYDFTGCHQAMPAQISNQSETPSRHRSQESDRSSQGRANQDQITGRQTNQPSQSQDNASLQQNPPFNHETFRQTTQEWAEIMSREVQRDFEAAQRTADLPAQPVNQPDNQNPLAQLINPVQVPAPYDQAAYEQIRLFAGLTFEGFNELPQAQRWDPERQIPVEYIVSQGHARPVNHPREIRQDIMPINPAEVYCGGQTANCSSTQVRVTTLSGEPRDRGGRRADPESTAVRSHQHVDIGVPEGTEVHSPRSGPLIYETTDSDGFGSLRMIMHEDDNYYYFVIYAHLNYFGDQTPGQDLPAGAVIGYSGGVVDGNGTIQPHLDYGLYRVPKTPRSAEEFEQLTEGRNPRMRNNETPLTPRQLADAEKDIIGWIAESQQPLAHPAQNGHKIYNALINTYQNSQRLRVNSRLYGVDPLLEQNWPDRGSGR